MSPSLKAAIKSALRPLRAAAGHFVIPVEAPTSSVIYKAAEIISAEQVEGDYLEFGVFRGSTLIQAFHTIRASYRARAADATGIHDADYRRRVRDLWDRTRFFAFDSFQGLPPLEGADRQTQDFAKGKFACSKEDFFGNLRANGVDMTKVVAVPGWFAETCSEETKRRHEMKAAAIVHVDCDLYESTRIALKFIESVLVDGTVLIFDDWYSFRGNPALGEQRAFREWAPTLPHLTFTEFQKEGPWRNSFIVNVRP
jgi:hypothetical protein